MKSCCVVGLGYIGLPTAALVAKSGMRVYGVDINEKIVQKLNSGDLIAIAVVLSDLHRNDDQREQSYSERQLYEAALERLTREVAAVDDGDEVSAAKKVDDVLVSRAA